MSEPLDVDAIEEREAAATPGPWHLDNPDDQVCMNVLLVRTGDGDVDDLMGEPYQDAKRVIAITLLQSPRFVDHADRKWCENATFIAHAREDIPALIAEVRRLREALDPPVHDESECHICQAIASHREHGAGE